MIGAFVRVTGCDVNEALEPDLTKYDSVGAFFVRRLKDGIRPISRDPLVSDLSDVLGFFLMFEFD